MVGEHEAPRLGVRKASLRRTRRAGDSSGSAPPDLVAALDGAFLAEVVVLLPGATGESGDGAEGRLL